MYIMLLSIDEAETILKLVRGNEWMALKSMKPLDFVVHVCQGQDLQHV